MSIYIKKCFIPDCGNTSEVTPNKLFLTVPANMAIRKKWYEALNLQEIPTARRYCCEDHFDLDHDAENWQYFKTMGERIKIRPDVVPRIVTASERKPTETQFSSSTKRKKEEVLSQLRVPTIESLQMVPFEMSNRETTSKRKILPKKEAAYSEHDRLQNRRLFTTLMWNSVANPSIYNSSCDGSSVIGERAGQQAVPISPFEQILVNPKVEPLEHESESSVSEGGTKVLHEAVIDKPTPSRNKNRDKSKEDEEIERLSPSSRRLNKKKDFWTMELQTLQISLMKKEYLGKMRLLRERHNLEVQYIQEEHSKKMKLMSEKHDLELRLVKQKII